MKYLGIMFALALFASSCQHPSSATNGAATLMVHVQADPKAGAGPAPQKVPVYDSQKPVDRGAFAKVDYSDLDEIIVWLEPAAGATAATPANPATIDIDPAKLSGSLTDAVSVGQQLTLHNAGTSPLTIYSVSDGNDFDFESVPANGQAEYTVRSPGLIEVLTNAKTDESVKIYAAPSPWVRLAHSGETLIFNNLPPGKYRLVSWHPRIPGSQTEVNLSADQTTDTSINVSVNSLPKVGPGSRG
jgi:hypothetical protein